VVDQQPDQRRAIYHGQPHLVCLRRWRLSPTPPRKPPANSTTDDLGLGLLKSVVLGAKFHHESLPPTPIAMTAMPMWKTRRPIPKYAWIPDITTTGNLVSNFLGNSMSILPTASFR
jgi:hypothetical protein